MGHVGASRKSPNGAGWKMLSLRFIRPISAPLPGDGQGTCTTADTGQGTCGYLLTGVLGSLVVANMANILMD